MGVKRNEKNHIPLFHFSLNLTPSDFVTKLATRNNSINDRVASAEGDTNFHAVMEHSCVFLLNLL